MSGKYIIKTTDTFEKSFNKLRRRFSKIEDDLDTFLDEIDTNEDLGNCIPNIKLRNGNLIFKKRMKNTSARQGKSGGFRIIEYVITSTNKIYLLDIYSKSDQQNISNERILELVRKVNL